MSFAQLSTVAMDLVLQRILISLEAEDVAMKNLLFRTLLSATAAAFTLSTTYVPGAEQEKGDIIDTAVAAGSFKTLAAAVAAADLVPALKGRGPFTVFAPTDEAFADLPQGMLESLLRPENKDQLIAILTYHVVPGAITAEQVANMKAAETLNGQRVEIVVDGGKVHIDDARVTAADIRCSNGIIHVIDRVLLPSGDNLAEVATKAGTFQTLLAAVEAAGLAETLASDEPLTVFAPTDAAFAKLPQGTVESLLKPENRDQLAGILKYHVVAGRLYSDAALEAKSAKTLQGQTLEISVDDSQAKVNTAALLKTDIDAANGVVHVIDQVLLPPESKKLSADEARDLIRHTVSRGARLYNSGHNEACAELYMETMTELVTDVDRMSEEIRDHVGSVMSHAEHESCPMRRSWMLRHALNTTYAAMRELH